MGIVDDRVILGLDIGLARTGYGVLQGQRLLDFGVVETHPRQEWVAIVDGKKKKFSRKIVDGERLKQIRADIHQLCELYTPVEVCIEHPFFDRENYNAAKVLKALGVVELALWEKGLIPHFLHQSQVKKGATGYGRAEKEDVKNCIMLTFGLPEPPTPDDAADAVAVALCHQMGMTSKIGNDI